MTAKRKTKPKSKTKSTAKLTNTQMIQLLVGCVVFMAALAYASVPLYTLFCQATGFGGTTQRSNTQPIETKDRTVTVRFDGNVDSGLPWDFAPVTHEVTVKLGQTAHILFRARNRGSVTTTGNATYNVQPDKAGEYFNKIQCFCFTKQTLKPGQTVDLPVDFYIDPALADDHNADDVSHITLSYTFYLAKIRAKKAASPEIDYSIPQPLSEP